ncbi:MAG: hypothetical protein ACK2UK_02215 [Candidatus Promineifilaceae bacterium]
MQEEAEDLVRQIPDSEHAYLFADSLRAWLVADLNQSEEAVPAFTESRARALLRISDMLDDPTRHSFERLMENEAAVRVALFDLLRETELAADDDVAALATTNAARRSFEVPARDEWLSLVVAAFAWKSGYLLYMLDPASPPDPYSPAGQVLKRAAYFVRQQVQRSATERDKLGNKLRYDGSGAQRLQDLPADAPIAPLPPHFRPPIPVRYPEVAQDTLHVEADEPVSGLTAARGEPIKITPSDLEQPDVGPAYRAPIQVSGNEEPPAPTRIVTPDAAVAPRSDFSESVRKRFGRGKQAMKTTKLYVLVQEMPDGPGLYGLQVKVSCKGIRSHVAGTTTREGKFSCELPVPEHTGLTYDVDVTWPRELGGETERKSITLSGDRTQFILPFFRQMGKLSGE